MHVKCAITGLASLLGIYGNSPNMPQLYQSSSLWLFLLFLFTQKCGSRIDFVIVAAIILITLSIILEFFKAMRWLLLYNCSLQQISPLNFLISSSVQSLKILGMPCEVHNFFLLINYCNHKGNIQVYFLLFKYM